MLAAARSLLLWILLLPTTTTSIAAMSSSSPGNNNSSSSSSFRPCPIEGSVVLVTGANRGIGRALVRGFVRARASKVYAAVRDPEATRRDLADEFGDADATAAGCPVVPVQVDLSDPDSVRAAATTCADVDVVVSNAGVLRIVDPTTDDGIAATTEQFEINVLGLQRLASAFWPALQRDDDERRRRRALVQINSTASLRCPKATFAGYGASKAASYALTQALRNASERALVLSVHPGPIATDMVDQFGGRDRSEPPEQVFDAVAEALERGGPFHVYTDTFSRDMGARYKSFADEVVEEFSRYKSPSRM